jgi:predicted nucleotidyltransferase
VPTQVFDSHLREMVGLITARWSVERIVLFGSRARGDHEEQSDYDLMIEVKDADYQRGMAAEMRRALANVLVAKDLVVVQESTLKRLGPVIGSVYYEALAEGVEVYAAA